MTRPRPLKPGSQAAAFAHGEGDRWFERNRHAVEMHEPSLDPPMRLMDLYGLRPHDVLEIGASNGYRLAAIARRHGCRAVGVDVSPAAVADGRSRFSNIELYEGTADALPVDELFDLVIVNFVLHWIDRSHLIRCVAEIDRVLADGGHLILGDFHPTRPGKRLYHHLPGAGVYTFKQDYSAMLTATGIYEVIAMITGNHLAREPRAHVPGNERFGTWLLQKQLHGLYVDEDGGDALPTATPSGYGSD